MQDCKVKDGLFFYRTNHSYKAINFFFPGKKIGDKCTVDEECSDACAKCIKGKCSCRPHEFINEHGICEMSKLIPVCQFQTEEKIICYNVFIIIFKSKAFAFTQKSILPFTGRKNTDGFL